MIAYLYLSLLGKPANYLINLYMKNQVVFNIILVIYGVILVVAYYNLKRMEWYVTKEMSQKYSITDFKNVNLEDYDINWNLVLSRSRFPFITTSIFFTLYRVNKKNVIRVLQKKNSVGV